MVDIATGGGDRGGGSSPPGKMVPESSSPATPTPPGLRPPPPPRGRGQSGRYPVGSRARDGAGGSFPGGGRERGRIRFFSGISPWSGPGRGFPPPRRWVPVRSSPKPLPPSGGRDGAWGYPGKSVPGDANSRTVRNTIDDLPLRVPVIENRCSSGLFHLTLRFLAGEEDHRLREVTYRERLYRHLPIGLSHTRKATPGGIFRRGIARCRITVVMPVPGAVPPAAISRERSFSPPSGIGRTIPGRHVRRTPLQSPAP